MDKHYKLYVGKYIDLPDQKYSYYSPTSGYLLVYATELPHESMKIVPQQNESRLTADELSWLRNCKIAVNVRAMQENQEQNIELFNSFLDLAEKELKAQVEIEKKEKIGEKK